MSAIVDSLVERLANLVAKAASADYDEAHLHLYKNDFAPSQDSVLGDFEECDFTGYDDLEVTWSTAYIDENQVPIVSSGELLFICTGSTANLCYGAYLTNTAGDKLLWAARLDDAPFNFVANHRGLAVTAKMGEIGGTFDRSDVP